MSLGGDLGSDVSWTCDAVAKGNVFYHWLKNNQVSAILLTGNYCSLFKVARYVVRREYFRVTIFGRKYLADFSDFFES